MIRECISTLEFNNAFHLAEEWEEPTYNAIEALESWEVFEESLRKQEY